MIDAHIHFSSDMGAEKLEEILKAAGIQGAGIQCISKGGIRPCETDALEWKEKSELKLYVFGGIDRSVYELRESRMDTALLKEAKRILSLGCTGIKMLEGKPDVRKNWAVPDFDSEVWEPYWSYVEDNRIPLWFHVNDPRDFWDQSKTPEFAKQAGWCYDNTFPSFDEQYRQVLAVLQWHPKLSVVFPHFFFLADRLDALQEIFDQYPNVRVDLAPAVEIYYALHASGTAAEFFQLNSDRILYGTDIGARNVIQKISSPVSPQECKGRMELVRTFLETEGEYCLKSDGYYVKDRQAVSIRGLGLKKEQLTKIYGENFLHFCGEGRRK